MTAVETHVDEVEKAQSDHGGTRKSWRLATWEVRLFAVSVVATLTPVIVATARAVQRGWLPLGDDADVQVRSFDVFTRNIPLVGASTSASASYGSNLNHPGPLLFDLFAVPTHLGGSAGLAIGVALLNCAVLVAVAVFAHRRGGPLVGAAVMSVTAVLLWAFGSETLYAPWQGFSILLPFLFFVVLVWSTASGDLIALPLMAFVGSLVLQTHLTYSVLAPRSADGRSSRSRSPCAVTAATIRSTGRRVGIEPSWRLSWPSSSVCSPGSSHLSRSSRATGRAISRC